MKKKMAVFEKIIIVIITGCLVYGSVYFYKFNAPIIKKDWLMILISGVLLAAMLAAAFWSKTSLKPVARVINISSCIAASAFIIYSMLNSVLLDYFQPFSLYDQIIYVVLTGFGIAILYFITQGIAAFITGRVNLRSMLIMAICMLFILQFYGLNLLQKDYDYTNIMGGPIKIFKKNEGGYATFRIPAILVINKDEILNNGQVLKDDLVLVFAEARRNGSLDKGDIDLVQKISRDGGKSWSELIVVETYSEGIGKIGNPTPVFDSLSGKIMLPHIVGSSREAYKTYNIESTDGGLTWSEPVPIFDGLVGPGHGIMIKNGVNTGRLIVPAYYTGGSMCIYSDDNGKTWVKSKKLPDGNEAEIVEINNDGDLMMIVRTNIGVATKHNKLNKLYTISTDGGQTWSELKTFNDIKEPICMSSIVKIDDTLYYSHPDDFYCRGQMTIAASIDKGNTFSQRKVIYQGASGYSDLGTTNDGNLLLVFENGSVEYDERITLVRISSFN